MVILKLTAADQLLAKNVARRDTLVKPVRDHPIVSIARAAIRQIVKRVRSGSRRNIQKIKACNNISYKEAKETFHSQDSQLKSYSRAVRTAKVSVETQTDMTWDIGTAAFQSPLHSTLQNHPRKYRR